MNDVALIYCWEDGLEYGQQGCTCMLPDNHEGDHEWTSDDDIVVSFK